MTAASLPVQNKGLQPRGGRGVKDIPGLINDARVALMD